MAFIESFDYIIVGSGATGSVLANRLSINPRMRVLVLEAGDSDRISDVSDPGGLVRLWGSALDWAFSTEPQSGLADRQITINQGKVLGGSTSINAMMYVRGNRRNFDQWSAIGAAGWSYADVLPYFKKSEDYQAGESEYRGSDGPLTIRDCPDLLARSPEFQASAVELGYDGPDWDYNGARQENGAGLLQFHITETNQRSSGATAFLAPVLDRPNLVIRTKAEVTRLLFYGTRVVGVEYIQNGDSHRVHTDREVILSMGALQSPKLLMLSGIGPANQLQAHNIPIIANLPGVGQNLQDHLQLPIVFGTQFARPMTTLLTGNVLFVNTDPDAPNAAPDLQLNFTPSVPSPLAPLLQINQPVCIFLPILVQPKSIGDVRLRSPHPYDPPVINPNYLQHTADVQVFLRAIELIRKMTRTRAFNQMIDRELMPGNIETEAFIRSQASTLWHPVGTCKMGQDLQAVVDPQLRVYGVEGLRVADASVMPTITSGNTVATCFMIGEKLADMLTSQ